MAGSWGGAGAADDWPWGLSSAAVAGVVVVEEAVILGLDSLCAARPCTSFEGAFPMVKGVLPEGKQRQDQTVSYKG